MMNHRIRRSITVLSTIAILTACPTVMERDLISVEVKTQGEWWMTGTVEYDYGKTVEQVHGRKEDAVIDFGYGVTKVDLEFKLTGGSGEAYARLIRGIDIVETVSFAKSPTRMERELSNKEK